MRFPWCKRLQHMMKSMFSKVMGLLMCCVCVVSDTLLLLLGQLRCATAARSSDTFSKSRKSHEKKKKLLICKSNTRSIFPQSAEVSEPYLHFSRIVLFWVFPHISSVRWKWSRRLHFVSLSRSVVIIFPATHRRGLLNGCHFTHSNGSFRDFNGSSVKICRGPTAHTAAVYDK